MSVKYQRFLAMLVFAVSLVITRAGYADTDPVTITKAWVRATAPGLDHSAAYFTVETTTADRLTGVSTPDADKAALHITVKNGPLVEMREADTLEVEPGKPLILAPTASHVMLSGLKHALKAGETISLTLTFEKAGSRTIQAEIRPLKAHGDDHGTMSNMKMEPTP